MNYNTEINNCDYMYQADYICYIIGVKSLKV